MVRKYKKETIARNMINSALDIRDINNLDRKFAEGFDDLKKSYDNLKYLMEVFDELRSEYLDDKKKFIKKYAKPGYPVEAELQEEFLQYEDIFTKMKKARKKVKEN
jgi:hypothetical protein